ncbi:MAG: FAD-dependent oxidoreductase [Burkholderiales bacterium]|nr:FAD-dependent oxidoreductase [Burkholderiales bacterium]
MTGSDTEVLIVGAGPVGLTLAMCLAARGRAVAVVETRRHGEAPSVKCNHISARSMELFRRLGVSARLRGAGLPEDFANDAVFRTSMIAPEFARIPIPCRRDRYTDTSGPDGWWPTSEPPHRINQIYFEPILFEHAASQPGVRIFNRTRVTGFTQDDEGVNAELLDLETGTARSMRARYLVGCDGGGSTVRNALGIRLEGTAVVQRVQSTCLRAPGLLQRIPDRPSWNTYVINPRRCGTVFAIDGRDTWLIHNHLNPHEPDFDSVDRDESLRHILGVGPEFPYEIVSKEDWVGRRLVAPRLRDKRVFIAGDAAHVWVPYAGYGMNAGIADAAHLAWLLAARMEGWATESALDAYEAERQPITEQVSRFAMDHAQHMIRARGAVPPDIEAPGPAGDALRARVGREAVELNMQQFCCAGLNFGYYYADSPLIVADGEAPPAYSMGDFTPSTAPGCRAPHFWLADGRSLYDAFGPGYTLLRLDAACDVAPLLGAARDGRMPLHLLDPVPRDALPEAYRHRLVMCRADQHVVWRGDQLPASPAALIDRLRGS